MIDFTKPVQTRDGRKAVIISTDDTSVVHSQPVVAVIPDISCAAGYCIQRFNPDGRWTRANESKYDLQNVPEEETRWVNFYPISQQTAGYNCCDHLTKSAADSEKGHGRIACIAVTFKRGDGLNT